MDLSRIAVVLRPRSAWEAIDLGFAMGRRWFTALWLLWCCGALPVYLLALVLVPDGGWLVPTLVVWWFKPLYEPPLLYWASRAVFDARPARGEMLRQWWSVVSPRLLANLTWRRFNPYRSFNMAVAVLEKLRGTRHRGRTLLLGRNQHAAVWLTALCLVFELVIEVSVIVLVVLMIPEQLRWSDTWTLAFGSNPFALTLGEVATLLGMSLIAPFYVTAGFSLYINRRSDLEGWDIELGFRRIVDRRTGNSKRHRASGAVLAFLVAGVLALSGSGREAVAGTVPDRDTAKNTIEEVLASPDFGRTKTEKYWKYVGEESKDNGDESSGWLGDWLQWVAKVLAGFFKGVAAVGEVLLWAMVGFALAFVLAWIIRQQPTLPLRRRAPGPGSNAGVRLFDLDVSPESLPPDIPAAAMALLERGDLRGALSLLYRGMLARFVQDKRPDIGSDATEKECLVLVRRERSAGECDYFDRLTKEWIRLAYAHRMPKAGTVRSLCQQWREVDHDAG